MKQLATVVAGVAVLVLMTAATALGAPKAATGAVYALTNAAQGNAVAVFDRGPDGRLSPPRLYPTLGLGNGTGLGSQGGLAVSDDGRVLLAVNAGSNTISEFAVDKGGLRLIDVAPTFGTSPISVTIRKHIAFVLNGGSTSIFGYSIDDHGLAPISGSGASLSPSASTPSQIAFSPNGVLVVTERGSNTIDSFTLDKRDVPSAPKQIASVGSAPFGFDFAHDYAIVSDAGESAATAYSIGADGAIAAIGGPVANGQAAACWLVTSNDGKYAFTANAGNGTISTYAVSASGALTNTHTTVVSAGLHIVDEAVSKDGRYLSVLSDRTGQVFSFRIEQDGSLTALGAVAGLPAGSGGLVAL